MIASLLNGIVSEFNPYLYLKKAGELPAVNGNNATSRKTVPVHFAE
jgi:hypothetical protein